MASTRDFFIKRLNKVSAIVPTHWLIALTNQKVVLPFYHAISDEKLLHIQHLYQVKNTKEFVNDLEFLSRHFAPVDFLQFKEAITSGLKLHKPLFLLSFDDGLKEFHDIIAPILLKKGIPAVCFLNSAFIDNKSLFYKYKASVLISYLQQNQKLYDNPELKNRLGKNSMRDIESWLLSVDYANNAKLDEFASAIGCNFNEYLNSVQPYLTSGQIKKLIKDGFHFGAHSIDHPEYRFLQFDEQIKQTAESLLFIKQKFSLDYSLFSFPFTDYGVSDRFFKTINNKKIADISFGGAGLKKELYPTHFQRIAFERGKLSAGQIYKTELIYSAIQNLIGKNVIRRT